MKNRSITIIFIVFITVIFLGSCAGLIPCKGRGICFGEGTCNLSGICDGTGECEGSGACEGFGVCKGIFTCDGTESVDETGAKTCIGFSTCEGVGRCEGFAACEGKMQCNGKGQCDGEGKCKGQGRCAPTLTSKGEPTLKTALAAPSGYLAQGYLGIKSLVEIISILDEKDAANITLQLPEETITKSNIKEARKKYERRLSLYSEAIEKRGYKTVSGLYNGKTTESCARIKSSLVGVIHEQRQSVIEITQEGRDAQFVVRLKHEGEEVSLENPAAIVESAIAVQSSMNTDYHFRGFIRDQRIIIKPDVSVLDTWPQWANPPSIEDLRNCTITLTPL